jgi:calcineurin-like phosphoesterase family protein
MSTIAEPIHLCAVTNGFDVIGDVHGQFDKLVGLLQVLGYRETAGAWRHPDRMAIFLGDLIDRGPKQWATVDLVRRMIDAGTARCVMGNHELNAIAWVTRDPAKPGKFLRDHHMPGNLAQHQTFLEEVEGTRHQEIIAWFKTLPLWLDLGKLRIVHACWHQESMSQLEPLLGPNQTLTDELIVLGNKRGHRAFEALEVVCKGPDIRLQAGISFQENYGELPNEVRLSWWLPDVEWRTRPYSGPPVIFGHYWFTGIPEVISKQFACLDYSVAKGGPLVAYRWDGESELSSEKLEWV